jgi:antitoxin YefM
MQIVNFSDARNNLKGLIDRVVEDADYTVIARRDAPNAVIVSQEYFDSMMETVHLLKVPANAAHLQKSIAQYRQGKAKVRKLTAEA